MFDFNKKRKKIKKCSHKKLVGKRVEWAAIAGGMPQGCLKCSKVFVPDIPKVIKTASGFGIYLCKDCLGSVVCDSCGKSHIKESELYVAECLYCNKILFLCEKCAEKRLYIDFSKGPEPEEVISKLYSIIEELMDMGKRKRNKMGFFSNMFKKKKRPNMQQLFPLIMNINMYFSDDMDVDFYYDDGFENEDWWMN